MIKNYYYDILAILAVLMWSFSFPASKVVYKYFSLLDIVLFRYLIASIFFIAIYQLGYIAKLKKEHYLRAFLVAMVGVTGYQLLFVSGIVLVSSATASIIISMTPLFAALLSFLLYQEKLKNYQIIGTLIGFLGVLMIGLSKTTHGSLTGIALLILASIAMGAYFVLQKPLLAHYSSMDIVCYNTWFGALSLIWQLPSLLDSLSKGPSTQSLISVAIMGIFSSGIGFIFWFKAIASQRSTQITNYMYLQPLIVGIIAWRWIGDIPSKQAVIGGCIILISLLIANGKLKRKNND